MEYGRLTGYFTTVVRDGGDDITVPLEGSVSIHPAISHFTCDGVTVLPAEAVVGLVEGHLTYEGDQFIDLASTSSEGQNPPLFAYRLVSHFSYADQQVRFDSFYFYLPPGETVDLTTVTPVANADEPGIIVGPRGLTGLTGPTGTVGGNWYDTGPGEVEPDLALLFANTLL